MRLVCVSLITLAIARSAFAQAPVIWEERLDGTRGDTWRAVTATGKTVVVAGNVTPGSDLLVRGYKTQTGKVRWAESVSPTGGPPIVAASSGDMVYIGTTVPGSQGFPYLAVHGYDASSGQRMWADASHVDRFNGIVGLAANRAAVVAIGNRLDQTNRTGVLVRAYEPSTGAVLWENSIDSVFAGSVAITATRVFVSVGFEKVPGPGVGSIGSNTSVSAYDIATGARLWQTGDLPYAPAALAANGNRVFVGGLDLKDAVPASLRIGITTALNANIGKVLWQHEAEGELHDLQVRAGRLVEIGSGCADTLHVCPSGLRVAPMIRVLDANKGKLLWEDRTIPGPEPGREASWERVELGQHGIYVAGNTFLRSSSSDDHVLVRAYTFDGAMLWEDMPLRSSTTSRTEDVALKGGRLFVAGHIGTPSVFPVVGDIDYYLRAYDVRDFDDDDGQ